MSLKVLLEDEIQELFNNNPELKSSKKNAFEIAVSHIVNLKVLNGLEFDDLHDGIMGDGGDEGIDLCYIFCNGIIVNDEEITLTKDSTIKVKFFQVKKEDSFSTDGFRKFKEGIEEIFNLELDAEKLKNIGANKDLIEKAELIRKIYRKSRLSRSYFSCEVYYISVSAEVRISEKIKHLELELTENNLKIPFSFNYWGAQKLLDLTEKQDELIELKLVSQPLNISEKNIETSGYAGFVSGKELMISLIDLEGKFKSHLTEGNIRFFLGEDKKINSSIIETAKDDLKAVNFWAMNNGITVIGDSIEPLDSSTFSISNPQIVNGCQTIHCLYHAYISDGQLPENLKVFVKLVKTNDSEVQTDIISATNSQNQVKSASLKANDDIQRNIEKHLKDFGIYYERRDNFYKRQGYTGNKVIGLLKMAQIIHTVANKEAIIAMNDTSTLFDSEGKYDTIFNAKSDYDFYRFAVNLYQKIWTLKNSDLRTNDYPSDEKDLISKGGFVYLNILSTLILSEAKFSQNSNKVKEPLFRKVDISAPSRKNEFTKRKKSAFETLDDDDKLHDLYKISKNILTEASNVYVNKTSKTVISLFKYRSFDREYILPIMSEYYKEKTGNIT
jgi:hypothetical protein